MGKFFVGKLPDRLKDSNDKINTKKKYWYRIDIYSCVLCGTETKYYEKVYDISKKGTFYHDNACPLHFL